MLDKCSVAESGDLRQKKVRHGSEQTLTPTLNSITPHTMSIVVLPSPYWIRSICMYRNTEQSVVKRPSRKMTMRPIFLPVLTLSWRSTGIGMMATTTSDTIVTMAYAVNEGPGARHLPGTDGSHDLLTYTCRNDVSNRATKQCNQAWRLGHRLTGLHARIRVSEHPRCPATMAAIAIQTTLR